MESKPLVQQYKPAQLGGAVILRYLDKTPDNGPSVFFIFLEEGCVGVCFIYLQRIPGMIVLLIFGMFIKFGICVVG